MAIYGSILNNLPKLTGNRPKSGSSCSGHLADIDSANKPPKIFVSCGLFDGRFASSHRFIKGLEKKYGSENVVVITYRNSSLKNKPLETCKEHFIKRFKEKAQEGRNNIVLTYSMGGVIAEGAIVDSVDSNTTEDDINILDRLTMISEVAAPHRGITNFASTISRIFCGNGLIQQLRDRDGMESSHISFINTVVASNQTHDDVEDKLKINITNFTNDIVVRPSHLNDNSYSDVTVSWKSDGGCFSHFFGAWFKHTYKYVLRDIDDHIHSRVSRSSDSEMRLGTNSTPFYHPS